MPALKLTDKHPCNATRAVRAPRGSAVLDGTATAAAIKAELERGSLARSFVVVLPRHDSCGRDPGLLVVAGKHRDCAQIGAESIRVDLPAGRDAEQVDIDHSTLIRTDTSCSRRFLVASTPTRSWNALIRHDGWAAPDESCRLVLRGSGPIDSPLPLHRRARSPSCERHGIDLAGKNAWLGAV